MAKQTRSQRRARREARDVSSMSGAGSVAAAPPGAAPPPARPVAAAPAEPDRPRKGGIISGTRRFIGESAAELKKVEWPTQSQLVTGTVVVLMACIIVGFFLYLNDQLWQRVVQHVLLR